MDQNETLEMQDKYDLLSKCCIEVGKETLPKKPKKNWSNISKSDDVVSARNTLKQSRAIGMKNECTAAENGLN